ncbi:MAG: ribosome maturation factor RimM [Hyphomonadaceae bacterium]
MSGARANVSGLIAVGQIAGAFGVRGEARVRSFTDEPEAVFDYGPLLDETGAVVITPVSARPQGDVFAVTPKESVQREHWEDLKGTLLHVPREALPAPEDDDEVYVVDLIGCRVVHADGRELGVVRNVQNFGAGDLVEVTPASGPSYFLPFEKSAVVDLSARCVTVACDDAFLPDAFQRGDSANPDGASQDGASQDSDGGEGAD